MLSALGLSGAAGLNAWLPLLALGLAERTGAVELGAAWADQLTSIPVLLVLTALLILDLAADKVPGVDSALHTAGLVIHPVVGAAVFDAQAGADVALPVSLLVGGLVAGTLHAARAAARPAVTLGTVGTGTPVVSAGEDAGSILLVVTALVLPVAAALIVVFVVVGAVWTALRLRARARRRQAEIDRSTGPGRVRQRERDIRPRRGG